MILLLKSPVSGYTRKNGAAVRPHERRHPIYVSRRVLNSRQVHDWARRHGFTDIHSPEKMHVTVAYSRAPVDRGALNLDDKPLALRPAGRRVAKLGRDGSAVLHVPHSQLQERFRYMLDHGASWDYGDRYTPHITISYGDQNHLDLDSIPPFDGVIHLGPETLKKL